MLGKLGSVVNDIKAKGTNLLGALGIVSTDQTLKSHEFTGFIEDPITKEYAKIEIFDEAVAWAPAGATKRMSVIGIVSSDLVVSGGNNFTSPMEDIGAVNQIMTMANMASSVMSVLQKGQQGQLASLAKSQTNLFYSGSKKPSFRFEMVLLTTDSSKQRINDTIIHLMQSVYPTFKAGSGQQLLVAPFGYQPYNNKGGEALGTVGVKIGKWFYARGLVITDVQATLSKEVTYNGQPLFAKVEVTAEPYRALAHSEFAKFFEVG